MNHQPTMNQHLQTILNFIQAATHLSDEEKAALTKAAKDANKEIEITAFKLDRTEKLKRTTAILLEETIEELEQKRKAVETQNYELHIETALERVRTVAMAMKSRDDMPEICKTIAHQLSLLGVKEIRNVQTAIFHQEEGTYMNYEYYSKHDKSIITETGFSNNEMHRSFAEKMMKGSGEFFSSSIPKEELSDWIAYQKTTNVFIDDYILTASSLNYYWYSLGEVALGISTYEPLTENGISLFKRFLKVFELSYTRYLDIEKAEAQSREARLETALERVRAVAMAMKQSDELITVCDVMFKELLSLGFSNIRNAQIGIENETRQSYFFYVYSDFEKIIGGEVRYESSPIVQRLYKELGKSGDGLYEREYSPEEMIEWRSWRNSLSPLLDEREATVKSLCWYMYSIGKGNIGISTFNPITKEQVEIVKRFRKVFELSYTRFDDLQKAEAQARESQIEAALESVRASSMAMHHSVQLKNVATVMFKKWTDLGLSLTGAFIFLYDKETRNLQAWIATNTLTEPVEINTPYSESIAKNQIFKDEWSVFETGEEIFNRKYSGKTKDDFYRYVAAHNNYPKAVKDFQLKAESWIVSIAGEKHCAVGFDSWNDELATTEDYKILKRFSKVFEQAYVRFLDLQKAEAQARESEIELALERVRARTMAMQHSDELADASFLLDSQVRALGIPTRGCAFNIYGDGESTEWFSSEMGTMPTYKTPREDLFLRYYEAGQSGKAMHVETFAGEACKAHYEYLSTIPVLGDGLRAMIAAGGAFPEKQTDHVVYFKYGYLLFITLEEVPEAHDIFIRFTKVFEQTYTRFLDLQKAEVQGRESQVQLALERVRARTMAMHHSNELAETSSILFQQIKELGFETWSCGFCTWKDDNILEAWMGADSGELLPPLLIPYKEEQTHQDVYEAFLQNKTAHHKIWEGAALQEHYAFLQTIPSVKVAIDQLKEAGQSLPSKQCYYAGFFKQGYLLVITKEPNEELKDISRRFASVFDLTYTRFLDLKKAEAQAEEAQVELSLERVRAKTMAMHNSADVGETAAVMVEELKKLEIETLRCGIGIMHEPGDMEVWTISTDENNKTNIIIGWLDMHIHPLLHGAFESWRQKNESYSYELKDDDLINYYNAINYYPGYPIRYDVASLPKQIHHNEFYFPEGILFAFSLDQLSTEQRKIFKRFAGVFGQTYRRYLDLKKAEAQAKEAQIEAALEKIRSRSLAMHHSNELKEVIAVMFEKASELNVLMGTIAIWLFDKSTMDSVFWVGNHLQQPALVHLPYNKNLMKEESNYKDSWDAFLSGTSYINKPYNEEEKNRYFKYVFQHNDLEAIPAEAREYIMQGKGYNACLLVEQHSSLYFDCWKGAIYNDQSIQVLRRVAKVFEQAYVRFLDLKKAEAQSRESQVEAALERVRSRTLAMQKSDELAETAAVLFQQLIMLGIEPNRLYISILKDEKGASEFWITDEDGTKISTAFAADLNDNAYFKKMYEGWQQQQKSLIIDMQGEELQNYFAHLTSLGVPFKDGLLQKRRVQDIAYFSQGFIGIASPEDQPAETMQLLQRFAAVFNLTFARFNDLKVAEAHSLQAEQDLIEIKAAREKAEEALAELQITQRQLIQSEKMASLGELTAGIAHEIQNPLNFVNNFSEVSNELVDELKSEKSKPKSERDDQLEDEILNDIAANLQKINHHGKRADAIVKGMLQHSRKSEGQKEPTDINVLVDEYLRLSYHGLRAKDNSFNATIETVFDKSIGNINIIPQDIGRVVLNIITNAFYAVAEKKKTTTGYEPKVTVITKALKSPSGDLGAIVSISDNGSGIPSGIVDKIFQPFFTTKPTGQGTGLGLSLAYDIIKTHNGEIKVETKEGEGTVFIIQLNS